MKANTSTAYFNNPKFDLAEWAQLISLWTSFMIDGLMATLYSFCDWLEEQRTIQMGDLHEPNRTYPSPEVETDDDPVTTINPDPVTTATIDLDPVTTVNPDPEIDPDDNATVTYRDLQMMLRQYRDNRGPIKVKLNAKQSVLWAEVMRLKLLA